MEDPNYDDCIQTYTNKLVDEDLTKVTSGGSVERKDTRKTLGCEHD